MRSLSRENLSPGYRLQVAVVVMGVAPSASWALPSHVYFCLVPDSHSGTHSGHPDPVGSAPQLIGVNTLTQNHGEAICSCFPKCSQLTHAPLLRQPPATEGLAEDQN